MWGDSCLQLTPGAAKIAYSEIASTKTKFFAPFCDNIIIIAQHFPRKIARCCFLLRFYVLCNVNVFTFYYDAETIASIEYSLTKQ